MTDDIEASCASGYPCQVTTMFDAPLLPLQEHRGQPGVSRLGQLTFHLKGDQVRTALEPMGFQNLPIEILNAREEQSSNIANG